MPVRKTPAADVRRRYRLHAEIGLALALGAVILAFTVPTPPSEAAPIAPRADGPIELTDVPPTRFEPPPPPAPPAPPPPVAVPDTEEILDEILPLVDLPEFALTPPTPPDPPTPDAAPVLPHIEPPPAPTDAIIDPERVWIVVERAPVLIGGIEALQRRVAYPAQAARADIEGRVVVQFVVDERGRVVDPVAVQSPHPVLSEAALAAVRASRFEPGQQQGRPVKVRFTVPVTFRLR